MSVNEYNHALGELLMLSGHLNYRNFSVEEAKAFNKLFDVIEEYERKKMEFLVGITKMYRSNAF